METLQDHDFILEASHRQCVEELFDDYADDFDRHLGALRYDIPSCLLAMLPMAKFNRCIDLGCGTGLAGARVRARCTLLEGVDLSQCMIEKAREKEIYDDLHCRDLVAHLRRQADSTCDLIIATDVVMYLYSIAPFIAEAERVLSAGGILAFSTESASEDEAPTGVVERASERFAHTRKLILELAAHFTAEEVKEVDVRLDGSAGPIKGDIFLLRLQAGEAHVER
ncbi:bioC [Symbiodinium microadriaticum]|nr:bioC [Symbiodinium microadriaticum]